VFYRAVSINAIRIGVMIGLGTILMLLLQRPDDIGTSGITTTVVLVVARLDQTHALQQPPLRLLDTVVGIAVGVYPRSVAALISLAG
jgi:hypothetical protein